MEVKSARNSLLHSMLGQETRALEPDLWLRNRLFRVTVGRFEPSGPGSHHLYLCQRSLGRLHEVIIVTQGLMART